MKGKTIVVKGKVRDVGRTTFGKHVYVSLTVGQIDKFERMNIQFNVSDIVAETVKSWMKGEERIMRGWIKEDGDRIEDDIVCADGVPVSFEAYNEAMKSFKDVQ